MDEEIKKVEEKGERERRWRWETGMRLREVEEVRRRDRNENGEGLRGLIKAAIHPLPAHPFITPTPTHAPPPQASHALLPVDTLRIIDIEEGKGGCENGKCRSCLACSSPLLLPLSNPLLPLSILSYVSLIVLHYFPSFSFSSLLPLFFKFFPLIIIFISVLSSFSFHLFLSSILPSSPLILHHLPSPFSSSFPLTFIFRRPP